MDQRLLQLRQQVNDLLQWKADNAQQQVSYPLGTVSQRIFRKDQLVATGYVAPFASVDPGTSLEVVIDDETLLLVATTV